MQRDITFAVVIGLLTALIWIPLLRYLQAPLYNWAWSLFIIAPIIFVAGLFFGRFLSHWKPFFYKFAKFCIIGFLIAGIDFDVFNLLMYVTSVEKGAEIALFKSISFLTALSVSYCGHKFWTFESWLGGEKVLRELPRYALVTILGFAINVSITSSIINFINPLFGTSQLIWNNLAVVAAAIVNLTWNFSGYFLTVFARPAAEKNKSQKIYV